MLGQFARNIVVKIEVARFHENLQFSVKNVANAIMFWKQNKNNLVVIIFQSGPC